MINLCKYRKLGILMLIAMIVWFFLSIIALWNFTLASEAKNGGWIVVFFFLLFASGLVMFLILYRLSDQEMLEGYVESLLQKQETLQESSTGEDGEEIKGEEKAVDDIGIEDTVIDILSDIKAGNIREFCDQLLKKTCRQLEFVQGICYTKEKKGKKFVPAGTYALGDKDPEPFESGDGFQGEAVESKIPIRINDIPEEYFDVSTGLGNGKPRNILFVPIIYRNQSIALIEAGTFRKPEEITEKILQLIAVKSGKILHDLMAG